MAVRELDNLVDALAFELDRPVAVDDPHLRVLAYSPHTDVDAVRTSAILRREVVSENVRRWFEGLRLPAVESYLQTPAVPELQMKPRLIVPARSGGLLLAYVIVLDADASLTTQQIDRCVAVADEIGTVLFRHRMNELSDRRQEWLLVERLLGHDLADRARAAAQLRSSGLLAPFEKLAVIVAEPVSRDGADADDRARMMVASAVDRLRRQLPPGHLVARPTGARIEAVVSITGDWEAEMGRAASVLSESGRRAFSHASGWELGIGIGGPVDRGDEAIVARNQAVHALDWSRRLGGTGEPIWWARLGPDQWVAAVIQAYGRADSLLPNGLRRLLDDPEAEALLRTLETYLELAGDAAGASAALYIHRTTLYQRLRRVERITDMDLRSGNDRLMLHLGLRLWRFAGPPSEQAPSGSPRPGHGPAGLS
jgi:hypothetical protein